MNQEAVQIVKETAPPAIAAGATLWTGYATLMQYLPAALGCFGAFWGGILSMVLTYKAWTDLRHKREEREYKKELRAEIAKRRDEGLECQRCIDVEILNELDGDKK